MNAENVGSHILDMDDILSKEDTKSSFEFNFNGKLLAFDHSASPKTLPQPISPSLLTNKKVWQEKLFFALNNMINL